MIQQEQPSTPPAHKGGSRLKRLFLLVAALSVLTVLAFGLFGLDKRTQFYTQPGPFADEMSILIERGLSLKAIGKKLEDAGIVADDMLFVLGTRFFGDGAPIKAGEFSIPAAATMGQVLKVLQTATPVQYRMLIREGITVRQALDIVADDERLYGAIKGVYPEGSLLPDTYFFVRGESRDVLLGRMRKAMDKAVAKSWDARTDMEHLQSPEELLVLATIIEKETSRDKEKPLVSGVFHNRLAKGMKLQSDPTVIYGIAQGPLGRSLTRKEVRTATPYNTYTIDRLPPGPIALPSREALMAAGQPAQTTALFFVVNGRGGHAFADTYAEHRSNIRKWRALVKAKRAKKAQ